MTVIGVHEMHGRVHPKCHVTDLLVVDLRSSLAYFTMTHPLLVASKLPIKTLVARQLPTNVMYMYMMSHICINRNAHESTFTLDLSPLHPSSKLH